jgi:hypothetical protein
LEQILRQAEDHFVIGQLCTRLYDISCRLKTFELHIGLVRFKIFDEQNLHSSFFNSRRKIESLTVIRNWRSYNDSPYVFYDQLEEVLRHIGRHVKELILDAERILTKVLQLLNLMPNLEVLSIQHMEERSIHFPLTFHLELPKLRKLAIRDCSYNILELFGRNKLCSVQCVLEKSAKHQKTRCKMVRISTFECSAA